MNRALQPLHIDRVTKIMFTVLKRFILPDEFFKIHILVDVLPDGFESLDPDLQSQNIVTNGF